MPSFVLNVAPTELVPHLTSAAVIDRSQPVQATGATVAAGAAGDLGEVLTIPN